MKEVILRDHQGGPESDFRFYKSGWIHRDVEHQSGVKDSSLDVGGKK